MLSDSLILSLLVLSVLATDIAVVVLFVAMRAEIRAMASAASVSATSNAELAGLVARATGRAEQAAVELSRQRGELMNQSARAHTDHAQPVVAPGETEPAFRDRSRRADFYGAARDAGLSSEEVRLRQALQRQVGT